MEKTSWIEDDSDVIDVIDSEVSAWFARTECELEKDENADEAINRELGLPKCGSVRGVAVDLADWSEEDVRAAVSRGLAIWAEENSRPSADFGDVLEGSAQSV